MKQAPTLTGEACTEAGAPFEVQAHSTALVPDYTSRRAIAKNMIWNLLGAGLPLLGAAFCVPYLISELGTDRFGVLTLAWVLLGAYGLFDLGLGRALTKIVAEKMGRGLYDQVPPLIWTSLFLMLILGVPVAIIAVAIAPLLVDTVLRIPFAIQQEARRVFYLLGLSIPLIITSAAFRGVLEARHRFGIVNAIRLPLGIFTFLGPVLVLLFSKSLVLVCLALLAVRCSAWLAYFVSCFYAMPNLRRVAFDLRLVKPLLSLGIWMTVSNMISPLMVYMDRFLIGAMISISAVAYYATPYEVVTKLWLIPSALVTVLFPAFSARSGRQGRETALLLGQGSRFLIIVLTPIVLLLVAFAREGLRFWLGADFSAHGTSVLQWLSIGILFNAVAQVPFSQIQATGRADLSAKLHLVELALYIPLLVLLLRTNGIAGAAAAWSIRVAIDCLLLLIISSRLMVDGSAAAREVMTATAVATMLCGLAALPQWALSKAIYVFLSLLLFSAIGWFFIITPPERDILRRRHLARRRATDVNMSNTFDCT